MRIWAPRADLAPFLLAHLGGVVALVVVRRAALARHLADADRALAQIDDDAPAALGDPLQEGLDGGVPAEDVADDRLQVQPHRDAGAVADVAEDDGEMLHRVPGRGIGVGARRTVGRVDVEGLDPLHQPLLALAVGDELGDRDHGKAVLFRELHDLAPAHHRAVVIDQFAEDADGIELGETAQVDGGLGMAGAHQDAAVPGDQREDVAGAHEVLGADIGIEDGAHRVAALLGGDAGGQALAVVDGDGEGGRQRRLVVGDHGLQVEPAGVGRGDRRADDAGGVADDEGELFRRRVFGGEDQVALVLPVVVVGHHHDLAFLEGANRVDHPCEIRHRLKLPFQSCRSIDRFAQLRNPPQARMRRFSV